jgi:hypothetical protein
LKPTLYIETSFVMGIAKGQDADAAEFLAGNDTAITLAFPSVCFMEAFSVLNHEKKQWRIFHDGLKNRARELRRYETSSLATGLAEDLKQSGLNGDGLLNEVEVRLYDLIEWLPMNAEIIDVNHDIINDCVSTDYLGDPTDNLILCSVLWHAHRNSDGPKAFLSSNHNDFGQRPVTDVLEAAGVKYFPRTNNAIGWLRSQSSGGPSS